MPLSVCVWVSVCVLAPPPWNQERERKQIGGRGRTVWGGKNSMSRRETDNVGEEGQKGPWTEEREREREWDGNVLVGGGRRVRSIWCNTDRYQIDGGTAR